MYRFKKPGGVMYFRGLTITDENIDEHAHLIIKSQPTALGQLIIKVEDKPVVNESKQSPKVQKKENSTKQNK